MTDSIELQAWRLLAHTKTVAEVLAALADVVPGRPRLEIVWDVPDERQSVPLGSIFGRPAILTVTGSVADELLTAVARPVAVAVEREEWAKRFDRLNEAAVADKAALLTRLERQDLSEVVGADTGLQSVMQLVDQVSPTTTPVLLLGETGSGKEVVSRAIHARSARASGPIIRVNCAAIPSELVDAELFGHERGSFTGASASRKGWFERADGGTRDRRAAAASAGASPPRAAGRNARACRWPAHAACRRSHRDGDASRSPRDGRIGRVP